ncbi:FAD-dependent oxidoreductase [uncultured Croceitalea sp.]|uniref:flavin monoamine oxidase family protein n=1 Tax=uncultured Croceitalea sp. TaxID=1798908 RepID=UPI0033062B57
MKTVNTKYIIIGAGLSGLTTAHLLLKHRERDFLILEGRNRVGGRILTNNGVDIGATWLQVHHTNLNGLLDSLSLKKFEQYSKGQSVLVYNTMAPAHYFESQHNGPSAQRISGGSKALIAKLTEALKDKILLDTKALELTENSETVQIKTNAGIYIANKVVVTIPPKLASTLTFSPNLPDNLLGAMKQTHTWMSNAMKIGLVFKKPFWREKNFSGTVIGQVGPVIELYDHCCADNKTFALMGFINEGLRDVTAAQRKERILAYLEKYLGEEIRGYESYFEKDWSKDEFTSCENLKSVYMSPHYGNKHFEDFYFKEKLCFSGTETSPIYGGYLDGAVYSGITTARKLLQKELD